MEAIAQLVEIEPAKPAELMRTATNVASVCKEIVTRTAMEIQKRKYVKVEGWCSIASAYGCIPSIREVTIIEDGVLAICDLKRADGTVVASAEGFVGNDEPTWASRALYARRAMAQTRAISRVCRTAFAFVVTLMDAGLETTPAEEIPQDTGEARPVRALPAAPKPVSDAHHAPPVQIKFGTFKGKTSHDLPDTNLAWYIAAARKTVDAKDPKWHEVNIKYLEALEAEAAARINSPDASSTEQQ